MLSACFERVRAQVLRLTLAFFRAIAHPLLFKLLSRPIAIKSAIDISRHNVSLPPISPISRDSLNNSTKSQYSLTNLMQNKLGIKSVRYDMAGDTSHLQPSAHNSAMLAGELDKMSLPSQDYNYFYPVKKSFERPLLAFSFGGMLWAYYLGVIACLRDHFDLYASQARFSGISCGVTAAFTLHFNLSVSQALEFGMAFQKLFDERFFKFWFVSSKEMMDMCLSLFSKMGLTNDFLKNCYLKWGYNSLYFGVSGASICPLKLQPFNLHSFKSVREMLYCALCSMRTVPFFRTPGYYNGYFCIDGGVTQFYSIPDDYWHASDANDSNNKNAATSRKDDSTDCTGNTSDGEASESSEECDPKIVVTDGSDASNVSNGSETSATNTATAAAATGSKAKELNDESDGADNEVEGLCSDHVIKIAVSQYQFADLYPLKKDAFDMHEWVMSGTLDDNIRRFRAGYQSCALQSVLKMLQTKGLKWKQSERKYEDYQDWDKHVLDRINAHESQIREHFRSN